MNDAIASHPSTKIHSWCSFWPYLLVPLTLLGSNAITWFVVIYQEHAEVITWFLRIHTLFTLGSLLCWGWHVFRQYRSYRVLHSVSQRHERTEEELNAVLEELQSIQAALQSKNQEYTQVLQNLKYNERLLEVFFTQPFEGFTLMMLDEPVYWNDLVDKKQVMEYVLAHLRIARINDVMLLQYHATREHVLGMTPGDLVKQGIIFNLRGWYKLFEEGQINVETKQRKFDGAPMWIEGHYMCIYDEQGRISGCFGIQREVTRHKHTEQALRKSEERFRQVIHSISDSVYVTELPEGGKPVNRYHSPNIEHVAGYSAGTFMKDWDFWMTHVIYPEDRAAALAQAQKLAAGFDSEVEYRLLRPDGQIVWVRDSGRVHRQEDGTKVVYGVLSNVTKRKRAEELLHHSIKEQEQRTRELYLLNHMGGLLQTCQTEKETYSVVINICRLLFPMSSGCLYVLEQESNSLQKVHHWGETCTESEEQSLADYYKAYQQQRTHHDPSEATSLDSTLAYFPQERIVYAAITTLEELLGILCLSFASPEPEYSEKEWRQEMDTKRMVIARIAEHYALFLNNLRLRETLRVEAIRDPLTGLYNRRYMEAAFQREIARATRHQISVGIMLLDLDYFKKFNDTYGHLTGDLLLQEIAAILQQSTRLEDIACRYGGEEFLLILPGASLESTQYRAHDILGKIRRFQFPFQQQTLSVTMSIGVATGPDHGLELEQLIHQADIALYQAKANGRNQVVVASS